MVANARQEGITDYNDRDSCRGSELGQALEWIQLVAQHLLSQFGLKREGEMWYQGKPNMFPYMCQHRH